MTVEVEAYGRRYGVDVRQVPNGWMVTTDARAQFVGIAGSAGRWSLLVGPAKAGHYVPSAGFESYEVAIESPGSGELLVTVNGNTTAVTVVSPVGLRPRRWRPSGSLGSAGHRRITAPMPGRIIKILVRTGEKVSARQGLVVVEAMKMENELRAPVAGTVSAVRVSEGEAVEANEVLIEME